MLYYNSGQSKRFTINMMRRLQVDFNNLTTFNYYPLGMSKPAGFNATFDTATDNGTIDTGINNWAIDWTISDRNLDDAKSEIYASLAAYRYEKEQTPISYLGSNIDMARDALAMIAIAHSKVIIDPAATIDFKTMSGWVNYNATLMTDLAAAAVNHIQLHFTAEKNVAVLINATTTIIELRALDIYTEFDSRV